MSLHVMPGDTVKMEVYAKYLEKAKTKDAITNMASIVGAAFGVTEAGEAPQVANAVKEALATGQAGLWHSHAFAFAKDETIPKAYLNYLFFDKDMNYKSGGFQQVTEDALGNFEELTLDYVPEEEGYMMIYTANQTSEDLNVYFDDMAVTHTSGPIIRTDDYYPFGLTFNTSVLDGALTNRFLFNGIERDTELGLNWDIAEFRSYDPAIARWLQIDPKTSEKESPYVGMGNSPIFYSDPLGDTVRVGGLDVYTMVNLVWSLSEITGNNIGVENGVLVNHGENKEAQKKSEDAATYVDNLISSEGVITVKSISDEKLSNGSSGGAIELNTGKINDRLNSVGETMGFGMTFLHESLHTWTGVYSLEGASTTRTDPFGDPITDPKDPRYNPNATGETVDLVNRFRSQLGWSRRDSYFNTENKDSYGNIISTTLPFGGKNVNPTW